MSCIYCFSRTWRIALALIKHSSYSFIGSLFAVMALPTEKDKYFLVELYKILLITTLKSNLLSGVKYPIEHEYIIHLVSSKVSIIFIAEIFGAPVMLPIG